MKRFLAVSVLPLTLLLLAGCGAFEPGYQRKPKTISRIAFGSCMNTNQHPMLDRVLKLDFDLMLLLGDNIYADTTNMTVMAQKYDVMKQSAFWKALRKKAPVLATWDDHDMGGNDAGKEYPLKDESKKLFFDFMDRENGVQRYRPGVYDMGFFGPDHRRINVIMLDTRYFRDKPAKGKNNAVPSGGPYIPQTDTNTTILGEEQWQWLEQSLKIPAELTIIGSSIQFLSEFHGGEAWANFPHEKRRMLDLLKKNKVKNVLFISGDRHWAELSRLDRRGDDPIYDLTSSSLTQEHPRGSPTPNIYRDGPTWHHPNVGLITINWRNGDVLLQIIDAAGQAQIEKRIPGFIKRN
jgi:alkaline phosphatase D